ncbi:MAG: hypothetical protein A2W00_04885 [Candidatus Eisenbacteria bacterium RBG_16_71_46]|nr:MAG: hypothetical protein A2W00_04885 [Candidatus Eisenbacteria bacterium RBG_16_71_46]
MTTNFLTVDVTSIPVTWNTHLISIAITAGLVGQILQFGFANTATLYKPSGVIYDNLDFRDDLATPATPTARAGDSWERRVVIRDPRLAREPDPGRVR